MRLFRAIFISTACLFTFHSSFTATEEAPRPRNAFREKVTQLWAKPLVKVGTAVVATLTVAGAIALVIYRLNNSSPSSLQQPPIIQPNPAPQSNTTTGNDNVYENPATPLPLDTKAITIDQLKPGKFANYAGCDGQACSIWFCKARAFPYQEMLSQLCPDTKKMKRPNKSNDHCGYCMKHGKNELLVPGEGWRGSIEIYLNQPLHEQTASDVITISTVGKSSEVQNAYGANRTCTISKGKLQRMANSVTIHVDTEQLKKEDFLEHKINAKQASSVCVAGDVLFLVKPHAKVSADQNVNMQLEEGDLDKRNPLTLLSISGIDFRKDSYKNLYDTDDIESSRPWINGMWKAMFDASAHHNDVYDFSVAVGMGAFLPDDEHGKVIPEKATQVVKIYFEELCKAMQHARQQYPEWDAKYKGFYLNPKGFSEQLLAVLAQEENKDLEGRIRCSDQDMLMYAINTSQNTTAKCGYVNASAPHVARGECCVGNHFATSGYVQEETNGAISTAALTMSHHVNEDAWKKLDRIYEAK